ncbi:MAG: Lpg1974 family pore-forming outer membrane protein [Planctomycetota bacterium]
MSGVGATFLYLHTTDADVAYAQQVNGVGGAGTVPFGQVGSLGPHHEPGFRTTATMAFSACSSLVLGYSFFESDSIDAIGIPSVAGGGVNSLVHHPAALITGSSGPVSAAYDVDFQLADFAYRSILKATDTYAINWSAGGRYASLTQDFRSLGTFSGGQSGSILTQSNIDFDGGGLTFGLDGERRFGASGLSMYSKGTLGALSGRFHADYLLNNNSVGTAPIGAIAIADWEENRIVTTLDLEAGLHWTSKKRRVRASAGYMVSFWFNTMTTSEFINSVQANNFVNADDTLMFEGLTTSLELRF